MAVLDVNGAQIYYQIFGKDEAGKPPIVLIHGSTITGQRDWGLVAPLLGRAYRVIVPDCRGHGQSSNPNHSYSFKELADDIAALIRKLGYEKAHLVGHSNGGNVALVTLVEHPEVIQSAVIQAANAYVSPDLVEVEPGKFDPLRVAKEAPEWRDEMIELHGETHGTDYWRELLLLTVREIISEPNYTPDDLQSVKRPALVIQGENDQVNAAAGHAQFIAAHIPYSELWIPAGVGHNVHVERLFDWVEKILSFLQRRGDEPNELLYRLGQERFQDERETIFRLRAAPQKLGSRAGWHLAGQVLTAKERDAAVSCLEQAGFRPVVAQEVKVLLDENTPWALMRQGVADLRREPRSLSERVSQLLLGEVVRILQDGEEYCWVRRDDGEQPGGDGYMGWVHSRALVRCTKEEAQAYRSAVNGIVKVERSIVYAGEEAPSAGRNPQNPLAGKLSFGVKVHIEEAHRAWLKIHTPDGCWVWVRQKDILPLQKQPKLDEKGISFTLGLIQSLVGIPYLWGGRSSFGYDCSGLAQAFYRFMGAALPRDADQQCRVGMPVAGTPAPGDLLFFGNRGAGLVDERYGNITHVAISLGGLDFIHAKGGSVGITLNSLDPLSPIYNAYLKEHLLAVRRFR